MSKVVVDTSVMIASLFGRTSRLVVESWLQGRLRLCVSQQVAAEYRRLLPRFQRLAGSRVTRMLEALDAPDKTLLVAPAERIREIADDPDDDRFLECAVAAGAQAIVSSDEHLLALGKFRGIAIMTPGEFVGAMERG